MMAAADHRPAVLAGTAVPVLLGNPSGSASTAVCSSRRAPSRRIPVSASSNFPVSGSSIMVSLLMVAYLMADFVE